MGTVLTEGTGASGALVMFSFVIWVLVTWVCPVWGNSSNYIIIICVFFCLDASTDILKIFNIY